MNPIIWLFDELIGLYTWVLMAYIIMSWLIALNIINRYQPFVSRVNYFLRQITEPVLGRIRRYIPDLGGIDISPILLIFGLRFISYALHYYF